MTKLYAELQAEIAKWNLRTDNNCSFHSMNANYKLQVSMTNNLHLKVGDILFKVTKDENEEELNEYYAVVKKHKGYDFLLVEINYENQLLAGQVWDTPNRNGGDGEAESRWVRW